MTPLEALRRFFRPTDITVAPPDSPFIVIDRDATKEKLRLDGRAKEAGLREAPASDALESDSVEAEVKALIAEQVNRAQIDADNSLKVYGQRLGELALLRELSSITGASEAALGDYRTTVKIWKDRLANARDAIQDSYQELQIFKEENKLRRPAHEAPSHLYTGSALGMSWLVESLGNTAFLRVNDQFGLIGGFVAAAIVAGVNISFSAVVGRKIWPYTLHHHLSRRLIGWAGCAAWVILMITWNLLAGHFRDAKALGFPQPEVEALSLLVAGPFNLASIYSYGLLILGIMFAGIAAIAGFKMDDPYPGYGPIYRRHQERCEEYGGDIEEALSELREIRHTAISSLNSVRDQLRMQFAERSQIIEARKGLAKRFDQHQEYLESVANFLIDHYRSVNRRHRKTPPPAYFDSIWKLSRTSISTGQPDPGIDSEVEAAQASLAQSIDRISSAYNEAIESFDSLEGIKGSLSNGKA